MEISLKSQGKWSGLSYESDKEPTTGLFRRLKGVYVGKDGTELIRFPGLGIAAEPGYMEGPFTGTITGGVGNFPWTSGSVHYLYNQALFANSPVYVKPNQDAGSSLITAIGVSNPVDITVGAGFVVAGTFMVRITGNTGAPTLNGDWLATFVAATRFTIPVDNSGGTVTTDGTAQFLGTSFPESFTMATYSTSSNLSLKGAVFPGNGKALDEIYVSRIMQLDTAESVDSGKIHNLIDCLGLPVIAYEARKYVDSDAAGVLQYGVGKNEQPAVVVGIRPLSFDDPLMPDSFRNWESSAHRFLGQDLSWARKAANSYVTGNELDYNTKPLPRLVHLESYDGRTIVSAPGYGCMFEANIKDKLLEDYGQGLIGLPGVLDSLGVPSGVATDAGITLTPSATGLILNNITVYCRVACYNSRTGEIGRASEVFTVTAGAAGPYNAALTCLIPRWILRETQADTLLLYTSSFDITGNTAAMTLNRIVIAATYAPDPIVTVTFGDSTDVSPANIPGTGSVPVIPQLPDGSLWSKALKGHLFSGGHIGSEEVIDQSVSAVYMDDDGQQILIRDPFQVSGKGIPTSKGGTWYQAERPPGKSRLVRLPYAEATKPYRMSWDYLGSGVAPLAASARALQFAKGHVQFSEKERPGEAPEGNRVIVDRLKGRDVIACGRFRNRLIFCTDRETYVVSWGSSPIGVDPVLISPTHGCIAPSSMVETDVGLFWISDRGPVFCDGASVQWVGKSVSRRFSHDWEESDGEVREKRYLKARSGMMWNVRGGFDPDRRMVVWAMRTDQHNSDMTDSAQHLTITGITAANPPIATVEEPIHLSYGVAFRANISGIVGMEHLNRDDVLCTVSGTKTVELSELNSTGYVYFLDGDIALNRDASQSREPCDEFLMVQIDSGAFSVQEFSGDMKISGVSDMLFDDGSRRLCIIDGSERTEITAAGINTRLKGTVLGFEDRFGDRMKEPLVATATVPVTFSGVNPVFTSAGFDFVNKLRRNGDYTFYEAFVRSGSQNPDGDYELKWWGTVKATDILGSSDEVILETPAGMPTPVWGIGDVLEIGVFHMEMESHTFDLADLGEGLKDAKAIQGMVIDHDIRRELNTAATPALAWVHLELYGNGSWVKGHSEEWGVPLKVNEDASRAFGGRAIGRKLRFKMTVISNSSTKIKDLRVDVTK